jgi:hypothetical protein
MSYNLASSSKHTTSQGELFWGRGDSRLTYLFDLSDLSRRSSNSYEGKVSQGQIKGPAAIEIKLLI